jgi:hypothetical protein
MSFGACLVYESGEEGPRIATHSFFGQRRVGLAYQVGGERRVGIIHQRGTGLLPWRERFRKSILAGKAGALRNVIWLDRSFESKRWHLVQPTTPPEKPAVR